MGKLALLLVVLLSGCASYGERYPYTPEEILDPETGEVIRVLPE